MHRSSAFYAGLAAGGSLVASALSLRWILQVVMVPHLHCCSCGHSQPATAFQSKQARRRDDQRKCRACVDVYKSGPLPALRSATLEANKASHRQHMAARTAKTERAATAEAARAAPGPVTDADSADDPLRLARKAETVLRGRTDRVLLILENCSDDFNHVAVLRTCEALGVMRVWLVETADRPTKNTYVQPGTGPAAACSVGPSKAQRQLETRCVQRGFEYDRLLGLRRAQLFAAHLDIETFATTAECIAATRAAGRELWVTDLAQDALPLSSDAAALAAQLPPYVAVVLGAEAAGVSDEMLHAADRRIFLPMCVCALPAPYALPPHAPLAPLLPSVSASASVPARVARPGLDSPSRSTSRLPLRSSSNGFSTPCQSHEGGFPPRRRTACAECGTAVSRGRKPHAQSLRASQTTVGWPPSATRGGQKTSGTRDAESPSRCRTEHACL